MSELKPGSVAAVKISTVAALLCLAWALIALGFASLAPASMVPRLFQNYHIEHLAAFYIVALLSAAALPGVRLVRVGLALGVLATVFAGFRLLALTHKVFYVEDLACDYCGIVAALAPIAVGIVRRLGREVFGRQSVVGYQEPSASR